MIKVSAVSKAEELNQPKDTQEAKVVWEKFLKLLEDSLKPSEITTWFSVIEPISFDNNILTISVPSKDYYGIIEKRYNKQISAVIGSGLLGENGKLVYKVAQLELFVTPPDNSPTTENENATSKKNIKPIEITPEKIYSDSEIFSSPNLYSKNTFDNFVRSESNELAVAAAWAITNNLGKIYNPLFIYGGVGLGKTHLIQAIGNEIRKKYPEKKVYYTTAPDFTKQFTDSIANSRISDYSSNLFGTKKLDTFYRNLDVLIIDDVQNLSGKEKTQDFMYQIFNSLFNEKKHVIFSSDKPINQIKGIEDRLISRFQWGMTADIQPPNWEMRVAIVKKKFKDADIEISDEIAHFTATNIKESIRTIEGCVIGMIAESALVYEGEITLDIAEKVITRVVGNPGRVRNISVDLIIQSVSDFYRISESLILSKKRTKNVVNARQIAMYLSKEMTDLTLELIGLNFGGKDHATVLYAYNNVSKRIAKDKEFMKTINSIKEKIKNN